MLDFWATWCVPCVASLPSLDAFAKKHGDAGVKVFAVNIKEDKEAVGQFVSDRKLSLSVLLDTDGAAGLVLQGSRPSRKRSSSARTASFERCSSAPASSGRWSGKSRRR